MKKKYIKNSIIVILALTFMFVSYSLAKYTKQDTSSLTISTQKEFFKQKYADNSGKSIDFTPQYEGYYAIIIKGGDGGNGNKGKDSKWACRKDTEGETGGKGGVMFGIFSTETNKLLRISLGSEGKDSSAVHTTVDGGVNSSNPSIAQGAKGGNSGNIMNYNPSSGGSGAGSVVFSYTTTGLANKKIAMIAGGGGGSAGNDTYYTKGVLQGRGGSAGSNFTSDSFTSSINGSAISISAGQVYSGFNGTSPGTGKTYGYGAKDTGGTGGRTGSSYTGNAGSGNGATPNGSCGGAGGGGYAGGGSGSTSGYNTNNFNAGGGGGGSSFLNSEFALNDYDSEVLEEIYDYMHTTAGYNPADESNGYVIIMFLGRDTPDNYQKLCGTYVDPDSLGDPDFSHKTIDLFKYGSGSPLVLDLEPNSIYSFVAKGGNGGDGTLYDSGNYSKGTSGGAGGIVCGTFITSKQSETLNVYIGSGGSRCGDSASNPAVAGTNGSGFGAGSTNKIAYTGTSAFISEHLLSSSSGAATIVYRNGTATANLMAVAGGGGAGGSLDKSYSNGYATDGGDGGYNIPGLADVSVGTISTSPYSGIVYRGGDSPNTEGGKGGSSVAIASGGTGGSCTAVTYKGNSISAQTGNAGADVGMGSGGRSKYNGGMGGGGFTGGGGGTGHGYNTNVGGGGGGSSYIAQKSGNFIYPFLSISQYSDMYDFLNSSGSSEVTYDNHRSFNDGYFILEYLGENTAENRLALGLN